MSYFHGSRSQIEQTPESKKNNKQAIEKQDADKQSGVDTSHKGGKREKEEWKKE